MPTSRLASCRGGAWWETPTFLDGQPTISRLSPQPSTADRARPWTGRPQPRHSMTTYAPQHRPVLRRPVESGQYTSAEFDAFPRRHDIRRSLGRTGVCWDNAAAESFFAALKNEMYY